MVGYWLPFEFSVRALTTSVLRDRLTHRPQDA